MTYYTLTCENCKIIFQKNSRAYAAHKCKKSKFFFCSRNCARQFTNKATITPCKNCSKDVLRNQAERRKSVNVFCNRSCAASYNNKHKKYGNRRSKLEQFIENKIKTEIPNIKFLCNDKTAIKSELDFYFPELKLAFEINGIFHYEPIFGLEKLTKTQINDKQKFKLCHEAGIELCVIATLDGYMKKEVLEKYWTKFQALLVEKMAGRE